MGCWVRIRWKSPLELQKKEGSRLVKLVVEKSWKFSEQDLVVFADGARAECHSDQSGSRTAIAS